MKIPLPTWRRDGFFLVVAAISLVMQFAGSTAETLLRYDRAAVMAGQWWRILTGNLLHLGWLHLLLNLLAFYLIDYTGRGILAARTRLSVFLASLLGTGLGLVAFSPAVDWYVGLSGALHGLVLALCIGLLRTRPIPGIGLALLVIMKLAWEQWQNAGLPFSADLAGGAVIVDAHLYGACSGALTVLVMSWGRRNAG